MVWQLRQKFEVVFQGNSSSSRLFIRKPPKNETSLGGVAKIKSSERIRVVCHNGVARRRPAVEGTPAMDSESYEDAQK